MAIPIWPYDLPQRMNVEGYQNAFADNRMASQPEIGPPKLRRRTSATPRPVAGQIIVSANGLARLRRFWEEEIDQGIQPFWFPDQEADGHKLTTEGLLPLQTQEAQNLLISAWWLVQFEAGAPPTWSAASPFHRAVALNLIILP